MAKIDTSKIDGFENMSVEDKLKALTEFEYDDHTSEVERLKNANSKANSEAAEWKRKHNALLSEDEKKKQDDEDRFSQMEKELNMLRKEKTVSDYTSKFIAQGYENDLAVDTAKALADGNFDKVFANSQKFIADYGKKLKADALKETPKPAAGGGSGDIDFKSKRDEALANGDYTQAAHYTRLMAQNESQT